MRDTQVEIAKMCDTIKNMLLDKNMKYGDSAINPSRILSKSSPVEQILVRIDDKLSRIKQGSRDITEDEDVISDLIGYFILLKIAINRSSEPVTPEDSCYELYKEYVDDIDLENEMVYNHSNLKFNLKS